MYPSLYSVYPCFIEQHTVNTERAEEVNITDFGVPSKSQIAKDTNVLTLLLEANSQIITLLNTF